MYDRLGRLNEDERPADDAVRCLGAALALDAMLELPCWLEESVNTSSPPAFDTAAEEFVRRRVNRSDILQDFSYRRAIVAL